MEDVIVAVLDFVNCRIGSLERRVEDQRTQGHVNCRIGSLEKEAIKLAAKEIVNCRIGSLEKIRIFP